MTSRSSSQLAGFVLVAVLLLAAGIGSVPLAAAQETGTPAAATPPPTKTPGPTRTPAPTPTSTATLTALGARLVLAQTYLKGGDFAKAAELFEALATEDRGNPEALKGLAEALQGRATATAAAAPKPTSAAATAATAQPGFAGTFAAQWNMFAGTALAGLVMILIVYALARIFVMPAIVWLREQWQTRIVAWATKKPQLPPFFIGDFTDGTGIKDFQGGAIVSQALTESLVATGGRVPKWSAAVEPAPSLDLGAMAWIKVLWGWIVPPPRGYRVGGVLLPDAGKGYRLAVQRTDLLSNSVDASYTFSDADPVAPEAFQRMAQLVAVWLRNPAELEAELAAEQASQEEAAKAAAASAEPSRQLVGAAPQPPQPAAPKSTREVFDDALIALSEAQRLVTRGSGGYSQAETKLREAEAALANLQSSPRLRGDLEDAIAAVREQMKKQSRA